MLLFVFIYYMHASLVLAAKKIKKLTSKRQPEIIKRGGFGDE